VKLCNWACSSQCFEGLLCLKNGGTTHPTQCFIQNDYCGNLNSHRADIVKTSLWFQGNNNWGNIVVKRNPQIAAGGRKNSLHFLGYWVGFIKGKFRWDYKVSYNENLPNWWILFIVWSLLTYCSGILSKAALCIYNICTAVLGVWMLYSVDNFMRVIMWLHANTVLERCVLIVKVTQRN